MHTKIKEEIEELIKIEILPILSTIKSYNLPVEGVYLEKHNKGWEIDFPPRFYSYFVLDKDRENEVYVPLQISNVIRNISHVEYKSFEKWAILTEVVEENKEVFDGFFKKIPLDKFMISVLEDKIKIVEYRC